jgi:CHASE2 domain-containing sensor protein
MASIIGAGAGGAGATGRELETWATCLAAPLALLLGAAGWRQGLRRRWTFPLAGALTYSAAGGISGAFAFARWPPAIPILALGPLLYPVAGIVWGTLLHQARQQGYLAFLGVEPD